MVLSELGLGPGLRGVRVFVEQPVAWWFRLGRLFPSVQLAPGADGNGHAGAVRQWMNGLDRRADGIGWDRWMNIMTGILRGTTARLAYHPLGAVLYRFPLNWGANKLPRKLLHAALMLMAVILSVIGLCAVFGNHNASNIPNLYSLHSWIGITTTALFATQWAAGMAVFLFPWCPGSLRKLLKPQHVWMGGSLMTLCIAACISGINEKLFFVLKGNTNGSQPYSQLPTEALLGNSLGVLIVAFGLVVLKILSTHEWQWPESQPADLTYTPLLDEENT
ncbi:lysosomal membrane ascorbate-dependent ferrireductase CYB561A3 isoform X3 [Syngnathus scovelli]